MKTFNRGVTLVGLLALCVGLILPVPAIGMSLFGPKQKLEQSNQKAVEDVNVTSRDKLHRVVEGEKTPIRPVTVVPPANLNIKGDDNHITFEKPPVVEKTPEQIYEEYLAMRAAQSWRGAPGYVARDPGQSRFREETDYESGAAAGASSEKADANLTKWTIPLGWNLCLLGIGIALVVWAVSYGLKSAKAGSASFNQLYQTADSMMANWIREQRSTATKSTDPATIAAAQTDLAELEAARAQLLAKKTELVRPAK